MIFQGQRVAFIGPEDGGLEVGDTGQVVEAGNTGSQIRWTTGARKGVIDLIAHTHIVPTAVSQGDDLNAPLVAFAAQDLCERSGPMAVVAALGRDGHLDNLDHLAETAVRLVAESLRNEPSIAEVTAQLDPVDAEELVTTAAVALLRRTVNGES